MKLLLGVADPVAYYFGRSKRLYKGKIKFAVVQMYSVLISCSVAIYEKVFNKFLNRCYR